MEKWSVLLVDDEAEFVSTLAERLSLRGIRAAVATDGEEALRSVDDSRPEVVVLDVMMPGMSGLEVLKRLRASYPALQVILLTGHGSTKDGIEGMRLGAFDCLMKPINIDELISKIREAIGSGV